MHYRLGFVAAVCALLLAGVAFPVAQPFSSFPPGSFNNRAARDPAPSGSSFSGPADVVASPVIWGGLRAVSAAYALTTGPSVDLCDVSTGLTCSTVNVTSAGKVDKTAAAALPQCAVSCNVSKLWDQSGAGCHWTQATNSARPLFVFNFLGTQPAIHFVAASSQFLVSCALTQSAPLTMSAVMRPTSGDFFESNSGSVFVIHNGANTVDITGSNNLTPITDNNWHALQTIHAATGGGIFADGSFLAASGSSAGNFSSNSIDVGHAILVAAGELYLMELGLWGSQFTTGAGQQADLMNTNQHSSTNGYNF